METKLLVEKAKKTIASLLYITIATTNNQGTPWNSPVYSAFDDAYNFYWVSYKENQHSKNVLENGKAFIVIYDSNVPEGTGFGVYMQGEACIVEDEKEMKKALHLLYARKNKDPKPLEQFLNDYPRRVFRFTPSRIWVNGSERPNGNFVDKRIEITEQLL